MKSALEGQGIFLIVDEGEVQGVHFLAILMGALHEPATTYLYECKPLSSTPTGLIVGRAVDTALRECNITSEQFSLLLTDAASYMKTAAEGLKFTYDRFFHVTCIAHLIHNCAMRVRNFYSTVDVVISSLKKLTLRNRGIRALFDDIGVPPHPVVTRWASWLKAAEYYARNLPKVRDIVNNIEGTGLLISRAKESLRNEDLAADLLAIQAHYSCLIPSLSKIQSASYTLKKAFEDIKNLDFGNDPAQIGPYLRARLEANQITQLMFMTREDLSPLMYSRLQNAQPTTSAVERAFSMLGNIFTEERPFDPNSVTA